MNSPWSHAAMLLLGVTLSVGFYEGRSLVRNTAKAWTAATQMTSASAKRTRKEELQDQLLDRLEAARDAREDPDAPAPGAARAGARKVRRGPVAAPLSQRAGELTRQEKVDLVKLRQRQRVRAEPGRLPTAPGAAGALPLALPHGVEPLAGLEDRDPAEPVDTGLDQ